MKKLKWQYLSAMILALGILAAGTMVAFPLWLDAPTRSNPHDPKSPLFVAAPVVVVTLPANTFTFSPTITISLTSSQTFSATPTITITPTPTDTRTITATFSPVVGSFTDTPTATPTETASPTESPTNSPTASPTFCVLTTMIDDVEDGDIYLNCRTGNWFVVDDTTDTPALSMAVVPGGNAGSTNYSIEGTGGATTASSSWGGEIGFSFNAGGTPYDASAYTGILVYMKARSGTQMNVKMQVGDVTNNNASQNVVLTTSWAAYTLYFATNACMSPATLTTFFVQPSTGVEADIWMDDAQFVTTPPPYCWTVPGTPAIASVAWYDETIASPNDRCLSSCTINGYDWSGASSDSASAAHTGTLGLDYTFTLGAPWWGGGPGVGQSIFQVSNGNGWGSDVPANDIDISSIIASGTGTLEFWLRAGSASTTLITQLNVQFHDNAGVYSSTINIIDCHYAPNPLPTSTWTHVVIPLCAFTTTGMDYTHIQGFGFVVLSGVQNDIAEIQIDEGYFRQY